MSRPKTLTYLALIATVAACSSDGRNAAGEIERATEVSTFTMRVGDCYNDRGPGGEVTDVPAVPCSEPHDNEVYALFDLEAPEFPGDERALEMADLGCLERFESYVGVPYPESVLMITNLVPTEGSWNELGDREVVCVVYHMELEKLTGSVRQSGI